MEKSFQDGTSMMFPQKFQVSSFSIDLVGTFCRVYVCVCIYIYMYLFTYIYIYMCVRIKMILENTSIVIEVCKPT